MQNVVRGLLGLVACCLCMPASSQIIVPPTAYIDQPAPSLPEGVVFDDILTDSLCINADGTILFTALLAGPGIDSANNLSIWRESAAGLELIARNGDEVPGFPGTFWDFANTGGLSVMDSAGNVAFAGSADVDEKPRSLWVSDGTSLRRVVKPDDPAPGTTGTFAALGGAGRPPTMNAGKVAWTATAEVDDGLGGTVIRSGLWSEGPGTATLLALEGQVMPGIVRTIETFPNPDTPRVFTGFGIPLLNSAGQTAFTAFGNGFGGTVALYLASNTGDVSLVASMETVAPGITGTPGTFTNFQFPIMNSAGELAFVSDVQIALLGETSRGIWTTAGVSLRVVATEETDPAWPFPDAHFVSTFIPEGISDDGYISFWGQVEVGVAAGLDWGFWQETASGLKLVAYEGMAAPGVEGAVFGSITPQFRCNSAGQVVFAAMLVGPIPSAAGGIWAQDASGELKLVRQHAGAVEVGPRLFDYVGSFSLAGALNTGPDDGRNRGFTDGGLFIFHGNADFNDEVLSAGQVTAPGVDLGLSRGNYVNAAEVLDHASAYTGEFHFSSDDLSLAGPYPLRFARYYTSRLDTAGALTSALGRGWMHNYEAHLTRVGHRIKAHTELGRTLHFVKEGASWVFRGPKDVPFQLAEAGNVFHLGDPTGLIYTFEMNGAVGRLTRMEDTFGNGHSLTYTDDRISEVEDDFGNTLTFTYTDEHLTEVSDGTRSIGFAYTDDDLTAFTDARGHVTTYQYTSSGGRGGLMTGLTRPEGNQPITVVYTNGFVQSISAAGAPYALTYFSDETRVLNPEGNTIRYGHDFFGNLTSVIDEAGRTITCDYNEDGQLVQVTSRTGAVTSYTRHGPSGKQASITENGHMTALAYEARAAHGLDFYHVSTITHPDGTTDVFERDGEGNVTTWTDQAGNDWTFTHNAAGQILTATNPAGGTEVRTYDGKGLIATQQDPAGNTTTYNRDGLGRPTGMLFADGSSVGYAYDANDNMTSMTDENGRATALAYDMNDRTASVTDPLAQTTVYTYDTLDRATGVTDPLGMTSSIDYDDLGRITSATDRAGNVATIAYDELGRPEAVSDVDGETHTLAHNAEGILTEVANALNERYTFTIDALGRRTQATTPVGSTAAASYDENGNLATMTDLAGRLWRYGYDDGGLLETVTLADTLTATVERNALGQVSALIAPNGGRWEWAYDNLGRLTSTTDPDGEIRSFAYDARNRVALVTNPDGSTCTVGYDNAGNVTGMLFEAEDIEAKSAKGDPPNPLEPPVLFEYAYAENGRPGNATGMALEYEEGRDLIKNCNGLQMLHNERGQLTQITYPGGRPLRYFYEGSRLKSIVDWNGATTTFHYDTRGQLSQIRRNNQVVSSFRFDAAGRLYYVDDAHPRYGGLSLIGANLDDAGRIKPGFSNSAPLVLDRSPFTRVSSFNQANRNEGWMYTSGGMVLTDGNRNYKWDLAERLANYTEGSRTVSFNYDVLGNILTRRDGDQITNYVWNYALDQPRVAVEKLNGFDLRYYVYTPSGLLLYCEDLRAKTYYHYHFDLLGNTNFISRQNGQIDMRYAYDPFGYIQHDGPVDGFEDNPFTWQAMTGTIMELPLTNTPLYFLEGGFLDSANLRFIARRGFHRIDPRVLNPYQIPGVPFDLTPLGATLQLGAGAGQFIVGAAGVLAPEPGTTIAGTAVALLGIDNINASLGTLLSGRPVETYVYKGFYKGAQMFGASENTRGNIARGGDIFLNVFGPGGVGFAKAASSAAARSARVSFFAASRIEVQALQLQGLSRAEAFQFIRSYTPRGLTRLGDEQVVFHFTNLKAGRAIVDSRHLRATINGLDGPGLYAGTTPLPNFFQKWCTPIGWGVSNTSTRIPIILRSQTLAPLTRTPLLPRWTRVVGEGERVLLGPPQWHLPWAP
ncbi:MAG: RHS repeat protein [Candidatus Hydrogenedentes bacterium]|nr:RHS repeat protein [Candidatus Hydrogenedentota bacterium]